MTAARVPYVEVDGFTVEPSALLLPLSVTLGRSDAGSQPNASAASWGYWGPVLPYFLRRGARVVIGYRGTASGEGVDIWEDVWTDVWSEDVPASEPAQRFVGEITDLRSRPDVDNGMLSTDVVCVGTLAAFGEQIVGEEPWPVETDADRAARLAALLPPTATFTPAGSETLLLRRRDVDRRRVLDLLHEFGASTGSVLWEWPDGSVRYLSSATRSDPDMVGQAVVEGSEIEADLGWEQTPDTFTDRVIVEYGPEPPEGARPTYVAGDGVRETRLATELEDRMSAVQVGNLILNRWGRADLWAVPDLVTSTSILDAETYEALLALHPGDLLVTGLLESAPEVGGDAGAFYVEGWVETWDRPGDDADLVHSLQFSVTDVERFLASREFAGTAPLPVSLQVSVVPAVYTVDNSSTQVQVTVATTDGSPLPDTGLLHWTVDGMEVTAPKDARTLPDGATSYTEWYLEHQVPPGKHLVRAHFSGSPGRYLPALSEPVEITVTGTDPYVLYLGHSTTVPRVGDSHTLYAFLQPNASGMPEGTVTFQHSSDIDGPWTNGPKVDAPGGDDGGLVTAPWIIDTAAAQFWRASYVSSDPAKWPTATSDVKAIFPVSAEPLEATYTPTWTKSFTATGGPIDGDDLRQGEQAEGPTWGDCYGLVGYVIDRSYWYNAYLTKVELWLDWQEWNPPALSGTIRLGFHAEGGTAPSNGTDERTHEVDILPWGVDRAGWVDVTDWVKPIIQGPWTGLVIGPAEGKASGGRALGLSSGSPPLLRATGYRWVAAEAPAV